MSIERVKEYFKHFGIENRIIELANSTATVELASLALNCEPDRIAKTLSFKLKDKYILILASGMSKIDNHKFKAEYGVKAKLIQAEEVEHIIGHAIGGVCPFEINNNIDVYLDET